MADAKRATVGREPASGLYYEILGKAERLPLPILFIHGGGGTGAGFRATPDGRLGWADLLAEKGYQSWVTDWPGAGRSGYRDLTKLQYSDVVDGYLTLLRNVIGEPVIVVCHSMGGPITWKLIEQEPTLVAGVAAIAAGYPGNLATKNSEVLSDDGRLITFRFGDTGVEFTIDREKPYVYEDAYVEKQSIATSKLFPRDHIRHLRAGHGGISPYMILQRTGIIPGMPVIEKPDGFRAKPIRLVAGTDDPAHTRAIEERSAALLRSWGADAKVVWLGDRGIVGNGHYLAGELNHEDVLEVMIEQFHHIAEVAGQTSLADAK
jgi:pimeloyl-ACP methyl ester carboxylesterase